MPVLVHVSQATLLLGSSLRHASRIASETCEQAHVSRQSGGDCCFNLVMEILYRDILNGIRSISRSTRSPTWSQSLSG